LGYKCGRLSRAQDGTLVFTRENELSCVILIKEKLLMEPFISMMDFVEKPASSIVVCCSDGRIRAQVGDFINHLGICADIYAVPGGPLVLTSGVEVFQDSSLAQRRLKFVAEEHGTQRIILITHGGDTDSGQCAMARKLFPNLSPLELIEKQKASLLQAAQRLSTVIPVQMECYFATVIHDMVQFEQL
jgi:hypothetical protein